MSWSTKISMPEIKETKRFVFPSVIKPGGRISSNTSQSQLIRNDYRLFYRHIFVSPVFFIIHHCHHLTSSVVEKLKRRFICFLFNTIFQCHKKISCSKDNGEKNNNKMLHLEIKPVCTFGYLKLFFFFFLSEIYKNNIFFKKYF
jgi:hypothetical protein